MNRKFIFVSGIALIVLVFVVSTVLYQNQKTNSQSSNLSKNQSALERDAVDEEYQAAYFLQ